MLRPSGLEHRIQVLVLSHRSVGSNPGRDTCVLEQDTLLQLLLFTQGCTWAARVEVDIVYEKATSALQAAQGFILPRELRNITGMSLAQ